MEAYGSCKMKINGSSEGCWRLYKLRNFFPSSKAFQERTTLKERTKNYKIRPWLLSKAPQVHETGKGTTTFLSHAAHTLLPCV